MAGDQVAVEDVLGGRDKTAAMTDSIECISVDLEVTLTVCFCGEGGQADETNKWAFTWDTKHRQFRINIVVDLRSHLMDNLVPTTVCAHVDF